MTETTQEYVDRVKLHGPAAKSHALITASITLCLEAFKLHPELAPDMDLALSHLMASKGKAAARLREIGPV